MSSSKEKGKSSFIRHVLVASVLGYLFARYMAPSLLPHGPASSVLEEDRPVFTEIDDTNDSLRIKHGKLQKIYERPVEGKEPIMKGPESVMFDRDGNLYVLTEEAKLVQLSDFEPDATNSVKVWATATLIKDLGMGRPLGGAFDHRSKNNTIYIADTLLGLVRVKNPRDPKSKVELVAASVNTKYGEQSRILYANDVAVGPKTGRVYFTDSTDISPDRIENGRTWDTMFASKMTYIRGKANGRLLEYDPSTDATRVLADGIIFANGVDVVDKDETYLVVAETFQARILRFNLKTGLLEGTSVGNLTGYPDGIGCDHKTGLCYSPMPSAGLKLMKKIHGIADPLDRYLRTLLLCLPKWLFPKVVPYGGVVEFVPGKNGNAAGEITRYLQDPDGQDVAMLTGATVHKGKLYLGSLRNDYIGVYTLE